MRALTTLLALVSLPALAAPTGLLNDTGVTQCTNDGSTLTPCSSANTSDAAGYPRQDARFGRDAAAGAGSLTKTGGGAAGFDFTPLDASGNAIALTGGVPSATPVCVKDNVTNLIWVADGSVNGSQIWSAAQTYAGTYSLCGFSDNWRLPTRRELLSIVDRGASNPAIDTNFFPNTASTWYWTSDIFAPNPAGAWIVYFDDGDTGVGSQPGSGPVRLVRSGQ